MYTEDMRVAHEDGKCGDNCTSCEKEREKAEFLLDEARENEMLDEFSRGC